MADSQSILFAKGPRDRALAHLASVAKALPQDKAWRWTVEEYKPKRSHSQNALLWALYTQALARCGEATRGYTKEELHEVMLEHFMGFEKYTLFGIEKTRALGRSKDMDKQTFSDFVDHIVRFFAERGVVLDLPEGDWR